MGVETINIYTKVKRNGLIWKVETIEIHLGLVYPKLVADKCVLFGRLKSYLYILNKVDDSRVSR